MKLIAHYRSEFMWYTQSSGNEMATKRNTEAAKVVRDARIRQLCREGASFPEIAKHFGLSADRLRLIAGCRESELGFSCRAHGRLLDHFEIDACDRSRLTSELIAFLDFKTLNDIPLLGKQGAREIIVMLWQRGIAERHFSQTAHRTPGRVRLGGRQWFDHAAVHLGRLAPRLGNQR